MKSRWFVEYFDNDGFWYLDGEFGTMAEAVAYYDSVKKHGYELVKIYAA